MQHQGPPTQQDPGTIEPPRRRRPHGRASIWLAAFGAAVVAGSGLFAAGYTLGRQTALTDGTPQALAADLQPFWDAFDSIDQRYAGVQVSRHAIVEGAIGGMFKALGDPFSTYMTGEAYRASLTGLSGQFEGIGAVITTENAAGIQGCTPAGASCRIAIVRVIPGSPAEQAGLRAADVILSVDGTSAAGKTTDDVVNLIRGPRGTVVTLAIARDGTSFDVRIARAIINPSDVTSRPIDNGTLGYIQISSFGSGVAADFIGQLRSLLAAGVHGVVLDLRGDPGGFVDQARTIASQFVGSGPIYWEQTGGGARAPYNAEPGGIATNPKLPVVVLVDGGTASASEILAAALQDTGRGHLLGTTTYGKGTVQEWQLLGQEAGGFRLTIARWLTPSGRWINGRGLTPNVIFRAPAGGPLGSDPALDRAVQLLTDTGASDSSAVEPGGRSLSAAAAGSLEAPGPSGARAASSAPRSSAAGSPSRIVSSSAGSAVTISLAPGAGSLL